ncbi:MAG: regulatory protein GemA [Candidatus Binataceae bacterium]
MRLDDQTYRDIVRRVSGKFRRLGIDSAGVMTSRERAALIDELRGYGFRRVEPRKSVAPGAPQGAKIRALWQALEVAGALHDASEKALRAFVLRQTGVVSIPQWLTAEQANKVIEGLKAWHARHLKSTGRAEVH